MIDILFTVITGFPCIVDVDLVKLSGCFGTYSDYTKNISFWVKYPVVLQTPQIVSVTTFHNPKPGLRWKESSLNKMAYVDKLCLQEGRLSANLQIVLTLSKVDQAHIVLEQELAFKASGHKICYVAPTGLALFIMSAIADVFSP